MDLELCVIVVQVRRKPDAYSSIVEAVRLASVHRCEVHLELAGTLIKVRGYSNPGSAYICWMGQYLLDDRSPIGPDYPVYGQAVVETIKEEYFAKIGDDASRRRLHPFCPD